MADLTELRDRSERLVTRLLHDEARPPAQLGLAAAPTFSWFDPDDAVTAAVLAFRLSADAGSGETLEAGLERALDDAEDQATRVGPAAVRQALALFTTHNRQGRNLRRPRSVSAAPELFLPSSNGSGEMDLALSEGGESPELDYWREDALANEHHEHWHQVYPFTGIPPADLQVWVETTAVPAMAAILDALSPRPDWQQRIEAAPVSEVAGLFARLIDERRLVGLPPELFRMIFHLNDRHGELFFYMHQQMLARYDAELISHGLERVQPFGPEQWGDVIAAGHDPDDLPFGRRPPGRQLSTDAIGFLEELEAPLDEALTAGELVGRGNDPIGIDAVVWGDAVEATLAPLTDLDPHRYRGLHNNGHGVLAALASPGRGVMASTVTAIRDPIFWRWHKHVDDLNARWQRTRAAHDFADAPPVEITGLRLVRSDDRSETTQLRTRMEQRQVAGRTISHLTHDGFGYLFTLDNPTPEDAAVTLRVFLAPAVVAHDRRAWIEMDKFVVLVPGNGEVTVERADTEASVIKRPAETDPGAVGGGGSEPDEQSYCDCGWPWTLLVPRGSADGTAFRLLALCTDAAIDQVTEPGHCGSMSFCGAVERYPDSRPMGYPFDRPFAGDVVDTLGRLANARIIDLTIVHEPPG